MKINQRKMDRFYGSWKFVSCDNFDDYLKGEIKHQHQPIFSIADNEAKDGGDTDQS